MNRYVNEALYAVDLLIAPFALLLLTLLYGALCALNGCPQYLRAIPSFWAEHFRTIRALYEGRR